VGNSIAFFLARKYLAASSSAANWNLPNNATEISITLVDVVGICPAASAKAGGFLAKKWRDKTALQNMSRLGFELHELLAQNLEGYALDERNNMTKNTVTDYRHLTAKAAAVDGTIQQHSSKKLVGAKTMEWIEESVLLGEQSLGEEKHIAQVHPKKLCNQLFEYSSSKGVELKIGKVVEVSVGRNNENDDSNEETSTATPRVTNIKLEDGTVIEADVLVAAIGPWSEEIRHWFSKSEPQIHEGLATIPRIYGTKSHSMLVKTPQVLNEAVFFQSSTGIINDLEVYPRPDGDSYITGKDETKETMTERPGQEQVEDENIREILDSMKVTSPDLLGKLAPHTTQACYWPDVLDSLPVIGPVPSIDGFYVATGHSVWGILQGPATGRAMSELLIEGEAKSLDLTKFYPTRDRLQTVLYSRLGSSNIDDYLRDYKKLYGVIDDERPTRIAGTNEL